MPCVPTGQTEFLDIVSTYIHVSSRIYFEPLMGTNAHECLAGNLRPDGY